MDFEGRRIRQRHVRDGIIPIYDNGIKNQESFAADEPFSFARAMVATPGIPATERRFRTSTPIIFPAPFEKKSRNRPTAGVVSGTTIMFGDLSDSTTPDARVSLPERYQKLLPNKKDIHPSDLEFFEDVLARYGLTERKGSHDSETQFGEMEFFSVASDFARYALRMRPPSLPRYDRRGNVVNQSTLISQESVHPVSQRLVELSSLLLHHPRIRSIYMDLQFRKMVEAFPGFVESIDAFDTSAPQSRYAFFDQVTTAMNTNMWLATYMMYTPAHIDAMGILVGYNEREILVPPNQRRDMIAHLGNETFTRFLRRVITDAQTRKLDTKEAVKREILAIDGVGFTLMRTHLFDFQRRNGHLDSKVSLDVTRGKLSQDTYTRGACPAILKTESFSESGFKRPIAYEYAAVITDHLPEFSPFLDAMYFIELFNSKFGPFINKNKVPPSLRPKQKKETR